ncbi:TraB/GumN family protein [Dyadobacter fanqingshengii]|uniref:TraB/GumN family protein n=1 Tax=Dyadobacter fanqingshengii TaxID=2906443 RepID=A0A9X1THX4_9BACT|nr:TraB/GumN family protein [Dyadobacter fanqingshengii]MCF0042187.1 TraB/GumN family protein [Dyadobacter fanqingshengii]USJ35281.1 TraB/GumN family protein [Dyadobacter fanqingshengii]
MKKLLLSFVLLMQCFFASAQAPVENSLLWEITTPGQAKPSYLFGTIHLICPTDFLLSDSLKATLARTQQVALEIDMDDPGMMASMMKSMNMSDGNELKKLVTEQQYAKLSQFYKDSVGVALAMFEKAKPFILMGPLFNAVLSCQPQSYEMSLVELAAEQKSEVIGIETLDEQMAIFDTIPYQDQIKTIITMIDSLPQARKEFSNLVALYKSQKINDLYNLMMASNYGMDGNEEVMLFARNKKWVPRIKKIAAEKPTFFAVGAGHLGGDRGVISLLRKEGFKVRAIK